MILLGLMCLQGTAIFADHKISNTEAKLLSPFLELLLKNTEVGFVIFDKKPVCIVDYFQNRFFIEHTESHPLDVAIYCAREVLKHPLFHSHHVIFHLDEKNEKIIIINRSLFLKTVNENLSLFQYVLGPMVTPESLLKKLLSQDHTILEVLNYDRVLIGIVLGYGTQNALFVSRFENIHHDGISVQDTPPFRANFTLWEDEDSKARLLFLKQHDFPLWAKDRKILKPSFGYSSLTKEAEEIDNKTVVSSNKLTKETPFFIFGCLPNSEESIQLIEGLEIAQDKINILFQSPTFLEDSLELICKEKVIVEKTDTKKLSLPQMDINVVMAKIFKIYLNKYDKHYLPFFAQGLLESEDKPHPGGKMMGSPKAIESIHIARKNLEESDRFFVYLDKDKSLHSPLKHHLYYKTLEEGNGPLLKDETSVCVDYEIFSPSGNRLSLETHKTLNLQETIPGFAHGLKGMKKNEQRVIFIHPSLAYGVRTYLEKGIYLKAIVKLVNIFDSKGELPPLSPANLSFIRDAKFQKDCEEKHKSSLRYIGMRKKHFLQLIPDIDPSSVAKAFLNLQEQDVLSKEESEFFNQTFWNFYFADEYKSARENCYLLSRDQ